MPAAVYTGNATIVVEDVPVPNVGPAQVLVEVSHCGICGTDLHLVLEDRARPGSILGHEWAGTIAELGSDVDGWRPGDRVVATPEPSCGTCRACRRGRPSSCLRREPPDYLAWRGAFARYVAVDARRLARLPAALPTRLAALTEPTAVALHTISLAQPEDGDRILVTGAGPVGLLTIALLRRRGFDDVTAVEPSPLRQERARAAGATTVLAPDDLPTPPLGRPIAEPYAVAFECSGRAAAVAAALEQLDFAGTFVFVGTGHEPARINHNRVIMLELTAVGSANYDAGGFGAALEVLASGELPFDVLVEPTDENLTGLRSAMDALSRTEIAGKVLVRPEVST